MGIYLNPGKAAYQMAINSYIFIDKSEMILFLNTLVNTQQRYVSVSRPRRFGKTMAADMIAAYYDRETESRDLFENLKIANEDGKNGKRSWAANLGMFDVIRVVMTDFIKPDISIDDSLKKLTDRIIDELDEKYPGVKYDATDFSFCLEKFSNRSGYKFIIIIDEWDAIFRVCPNDDKGHKKYLDFLRDLMKDKSYIALAYMTGILPIKKYGKHSALNMFTEYSMAFPRQLAKYTGFTEDEVIEQCDRYGRDFERIKDWYNGYDVSDIIPPDPKHSRLKATGESPRADRYSLYSPLSVVEAVTTGVLKDYWNATETYEALAEFIRRDYDGLKDAVALLIDGGRVQVDTSTYQNDMTTFTGRDDIFSLLIHLGYLAYDDVRSEVFIPNREILDEFKTSTKSSEWVSTFEAFALSQELLKATWGRNADQVAELLEKAHNRSANNTYNSEAALSYAVQYAYYAAQKYYTTILELDTGKGFADIVYLPSPKYPDKPVLLIELKHEKTAIGAIAQIKSNDYPDRLEHYKGNILLIGINYDREVKNDKVDFKHHSCVIEKA